MKTTILFDIDGTLLRTGGAGMIAINETFKELYGIENTAQVEVRGRTDCGILGDLFEANEIVFDDEAYRKFAEHYHPRLRTQLKQTEGQLLPGVCELVANLAEIPTVELGILTGNGKAPAQVKLEHFGIEHYFMKSGSIVGGFGDSTRCRNEVAAQARASAEAVFEGFAADQCWVVGDTPADVECAKSIQALSVAVLTGGYSRADLQATEPDYLIEVLADFPIHAIESA